MAGPFDRIRKLIEDRKQKKQAAPEEFYYDEKSVEQIVGRLKKKYKKEGIEFNEAEGKLGELREIIAGNKRKRLEIQSIEALQTGKNPFIRILGRLYALLHGPFERIGSSLERFPQAKTLNYYLYSANMPYSAKQWIALVAVVAVLVLVFTFSFGQLFFLLIRWFGEQQGLVLTPLAVTLSYIIPVFGSILLAFVAVIVGFLIPKSNAINRGDKCSTELPFALRHMATELRAGIGLYRTIQTIAKADYGVLSEEFSRTIGEIEEGTDTRDALRHFAARTQSRPLANALRHVIRALKTGGNLSQIMGDIANDVSFNLQIKVKEYSERLNFFGVIFIFVGIVIPVFVGIIGSIANGGLPIGATIPLPPPVILSFYLLIMPVMLGMIAYYLYISQPRV
jgi:flagellar protein FlaJ